MDLTNQNVLLPGPLRAFDCSSNDVISFKLIRCEKDLENDELNFPPEFTHQIFGENERIFGYKNLRIDLYCLSSSLNFYLNIDYEEKLNPKKYQQFQADQIEKCLNQWIPSNTTTNLDNFVRQLKFESDFCPFGEQIFEYQLANSKSNVNKYSIYRYNQLISDDKRFAEWYSRLETYLVFYIDAASTIDKSDPNWIIYLLYEQYRNECNEICFSPIGFVSVYLYYAYPDNKRPRISQVLILPPYQRNGHGRRILNIIYEDLRKDARVQDITGEDPSDEFISLRDLVAFELSQKYLPNYFSKKSILNYPRLTTEMIEQSRKICKLTKQQTRRVHEMSTLNAINQHDEQQIKIFRLLVKKRLFEPLQFDKRRRLQLADPNLESLTTDLDKRKTYLSSQYEIVVEHYRNILSAFDKYQN